jgi:transposase
MECVVSAVVEKRLGALLVAAEFRRRLGLAGTVDRSCPGRDIAHLTHGQVIETLVANRLTAPAPLWRVDDWAREWAVEEVFGIEPELLNDDRLGRALDAIAEHLTELTDSIGARAIGEFGIDVSTYHWDMTSMSLHGAYPADDQDEDYPQVKHGHPKDRRYDLKQIQTGLAVTGDGSIPLLSRVIDGGAAEISQITGAMKALRAIAGPKEFLLIADSKPVSYRNITTLIKAGTGFIAPTPASTVDDAVYAALDLDAATVVDYTPARDENTPAERRETYRVLEDTHVLSGPRKRDPQVEVRRVLVHSTGKAKGQQRARDKRLAKAREELDKLQRGAGGPLLQHCREDRRPHRRDRQNPPRHWLPAYLHHHRRHRTAHPRLALRPGRPPGRNRRRRLVRAADHPHPRTGRRRRGTAAPQGPGHRRAPLRRLQGHLAVTPVFVQDNKRVAALVTLICLALLVFCLIERQVRRALGSDQKMPGLYPGNQQVRPTGRMILYHLSGLRLRVVGATDPPIIVISRGVQLHLLDLLGLEPTHPRWPET